MNDTQNKRAPLPRRFRNVLIATGFLLLFFLLLPGAMKWTVNRVVLPHRFSASECPVKSCRLTELRYTGLVAGNLLVDAGGGRTVQVSRVEAFYNPWTLMHRQIPLVRGQIVSGPEIAFESDITTRDIRFSGGGLNADVSAQFSRIRCVLLRAWCFL